MALTSQGGEVAVETPSFCCSAAGQGRVRAGDALTQRRPQVRNRERDQGREEEDLVQRLLIEDLAPWQLSMAVKISAIMEKRGLRYEQA